MKFGLVSNCWQHQLESGADLLDLVVNAPTHGFRCVELRQTCLGRFESGDECIPDVAALQELPAAAPQVEFNIAINVPFLLPGAAEQSDVFAAAVDATVSVYGDNRPHLRLVDLTTTSDQLAGIEISDVARSIERLVRRMSDVDGQLSVEHSLQSWSRFLDVFRTTREFLDDQNDRLRLCYDPVNLFFSDVGPDPGSVTRSLRAEEISMVHFKQRRENTILTRVADGDVDWRDQAAALAEIEYRGPCLFEIRSSDKLGEEMKASVE